jgi:hypothetical protein
MGVRYRCRRYRRRKERGKEEHGRILREGADNK